METLYYECHVTVAPAFERLHIFEAICKAHCFRPSKLLMQKGAELVPSDLDFFCTSHNKYQYNLEEDMVRLVRELKENNFEVRRYNIEQIIIDSRIKDIKKLL